MKKAYRTIEDYIALDPRFPVSFEPLELDPAAVARLELPDDSPVHRMIRAAAQARTGPMAAVAAVVAWAGVDECKLVCAPVEPKGFDKAVVAEGCHGMIENGGDIVVYSPEEFIVEWKIPSAPDELQGFAFKIPPTTGSLTPIQSAYRILRIQTPLTSAAHSSGTRTSSNSRGTTFLTAAHAHGTGGIFGICSSSGKWGHSVSMGNADIATVFSPDPALADACATALANRIKDESDLESAFDFLEDIPDVAGAAAAVDGKVAFWGNCPEVVRMNQKE